MPDLWPEEAKVLRRSIAMLPPQTWSGLRRERALATLAQLVRALRELRRKVLGGDRRRGTDNEIAVDRGGWQPPRLPSLAVIGGTTFRRRRPEVRNPTIPYTQPGVFGRGVGGRVAADA